MASHIREKLEPGEVIAGRYRVLRLLGRGGFASVYEGYDPVIQREVAIKVLHSFLLGGEEEERRDAMLSRFRQEASSAASIDHPNVVTIFDMGVLSDGEQPFIVMEMLRGHDLQEELDRNGPMAAVRMLPLFVRALDALGAAHAGGVVHRDLKPSNLFLVRPGTQDEDIRVVDFGIARSAQTKRLTSTGQVVGTANYLSPEYIIETRVSPGLDVYQMGLILVELLTGVPVVDAETPLQCVHKHTSGQLRVPEGIILGALGVVVARALEFRPEERYADGRAFADALREIDPAEVTWSGETEWKVSVSGVSSSLRVATGLGAAQTEEVGVAVDAGASRERVLVAAGGGAADGAPAPKAVVAQADRATEIQSPPPVKTQPLRLLWAGVILFAMALLGAVAITLVGWLWGPGTKETPGGQEAGKSPAPEPLVASGADLEVAGEGVVADAGGPDIVPDAAAPRGRLVARVEGGLCSFRIGENPHGVSVPFEAASGHELQAPPGEYNVYCRTDEGERGTVVTVKADQQVVVQFNLDDRKEPPKKKRPVRGKKKPSKASDKGWGIAR